MKRYLFFLRHYNDIDNIAPAIYFFLRKSESHRAEVILYDDGYDPTLDENLGFLTREFGERFRFEWLGSYFQLELGGAVAGRKSRMKLAQRLTDAAARIGLSRARFRRLFRGATRKLNAVARTASVGAVGRLEDVRRGLVDPKIIQGALRKVLERDGFPELVVFDVNRSGRVRGLTDNLRRLGVEKIVCLPVSPLINTNVLREEAFQNVFSDEFFRAHDYSSFDALGFVDDRWVSSYEEIVALGGHENTLAGKTVPLGSIRYCPEWLAIRPKPARDGRLPASERSDRRIRVVFFLSHPKSNVNWPEVERTVEMMGQFPGYEVLVKPHTRQDFQPGWQESENVRVVSDISSSELIDWAEVVVFWSTSVALEGYMKGKFMVCLSHVVSNRNLYAEFDAGYVTRCPDDFVIFLAKYPTRRGELTYGEIGTKGLLAEILGGSTDARPVPDRYLDFMESHETRPARVPSVT